MHGSLQEIYYAFRLMRKSPGFALTVIGTLALTIALATTVFSVLDAVFLRPLPYHQPERIVSLTTYSPQNYTQPASYPEYLDWRRLSNAFSALAAYNGYASANFESATGSIDLRSVSTSENFFDVFAVKPLIGRTFAAGEEQPGRNRVTVLSNEVWRSSFGARRDALGSTVKLDGHPYTVIGVMPPGFRFPIGAANAIYRPFDLTPNQRNGRGNHWLPTIGRLKPGEARAAAQQEFNQVLGQLGQTYPDSKGRRAKLVDLRTYVVGESAGALRLLGYAVIVILAIGCVNIAGLTFARGVRLQREAAVRAVLGASRPLLMRQFLTENALHAIVGSALGIALAVALLRAISVLLIAALSRGSEVAINPFVLAASLAVAMLTSLVAGLFPALRLSGTSTNLALRSGTRTGADRSQHRLRAAFVITQVSLALVLLVTAGLLFRMLAGLRQSDLGFDPSKILTTDVTLSPGSYEHRDVLTDFYTPLLERIQALPGVKSAGLIQVLPIQSWGWNGDVHILGQPPSPPNEERLAEIRMVTPGYYSVFSDRLMRGRLPDAKLDTPKSPRVSVVNEEFVRRYIPAGQDPVGSVIDTDDRTTIIGVVRNIRQNLYDRPLAEMDWPISQIPTDMRSMVISSLHLVVRTEGKPESATTGIRRAIHELDPTLPFRTAESMETVVAESLTFERLENWLFGTFAALAVLLAIVGLYGLISQEVEGSTRDIGVRMALGATRARILGLVYRRVGIMLAMGTALGLFATWMVHGLIAAVLTVHVDQEAWVVAGLACALTGVALSAAFLPAHRAATVEPMESLRME
jgi:predicted permease